MPKIAESLEEALATVADGCTLLVPRNNAGVAMAATRRLVRRGVKHLHLIAVPTSGIQADILVGAGAVDSIEAAGVSLGESGPAPRFAAAVQTGEIVMKDTTCPAIHAGLQASEKGIPFMPLRGLIGSDLVEHRPDWRILDNPFANHDPIVLLPAIKPDLALFHAAMADRAGNIWIGATRELATMAHAARRTIVTVEKIYEQNLLDDPVLAAGTLPGFYVEQVAVAPRGAWPLGLPGQYARDDTHLAEYAHLAATRDGFARYLELYVYERRAA
jgi:glutaconate CoA-transferase, subunit A